MSIQKNYEEIIQSLPANVKLVAVSKTHPAEAIQEVYNLGQRVFGENKVQEMVAKQPILPNDIQWHLIGHLQSNKVKYVAEFVDTIESVDSEKLLEEINKQAARHNRKIKVLLQVKIAEEDSKTGMEVSETKELFLKYLQGHFENIEITGLMGIGTFTDDTEQTKREFLFLKRLFDQLSVQKKLETLSMGMSGDYQLAIECGSTSVRIGSSIFGARDYSI
ncbi:YggS family pyridoxal phosphate-dependent enzyme [Elizabethkingia anophelis]|uniref:YggS family pyridoxal phosphate-dependent enzyme n=1 Tax=Elizabethkingia anophelis TaxID=1117645 RepID=UPI000442B20D|nr:YggS family pyridoxal phosphate-dependent enzyme [Elizabethkingia anophelis]MCT3918415.1 YggS family pyridoxal phosphate-dependent enzyme [Elizabethkingia anophelis]MCT3950422.1 YggS family pyridoxal phosphate-dependent enzyme [Elizabethkingia anophelis]MCT3953966.1 YggS family pyridoxal phosphate-dependent enzyme [Elizabethkingia anophelis]MCT3985908.1 YggS family pyridoxal phosphate-dependent enzyme [Elizabethkingia anophelis]MCT4064092.1 YggS family pyridoxal phosphate-dependent enzyme [